MPSFEDKIIVMKNDEQGLFCVELPDGTQVAASNGTSLTQGLTLRFPKEKFEKIFNEQMKDKKTDYICLTFNVEELEMLEQGMDMFDGWTERNNGK